jgi:iron complex outermembrane receptor protein
LEGSLQAVLSDNFDVILSGSFNENEVNDANLISPGSDGNRLGGSPKYKVSGLLSYHTPITATGELNASVDFVWQSSRFLGLSNDLSTQLRGYSDISIRVGYEDEAGWSVTAYVENVGDTIYYTSGYESSYPFPGEKAGVSRPRTFGVRLSYSFGE